MKSFFAFLLTFFIMTSYAKAEWHEVNSDNFRIIADQSEKDVREFTERLERYHTALGTAFGTSKTKLSPSNRVTVYVVRNQSQIRKLHGQNNKYVGGFYIPRAGGTVAFVPRVETSGTDSAGSEHILLHEYAHHFLHGRTSQNWPRWISEGFAEFYAHARFEKDGSVGLGLPAYSRFNELVRAKNVPLKALFNRQEYSDWKGSSKTYDNFYGRSWLLYHYLTMTDKRVGQRVKYLQLIQTGSTETEAAVNAFGDFKTLDRELRLYMKRSSLSYAKLPINEVDVSNFTVRKLSEAEEEAMPVIIRQKRGVNREEAIEILAEARELAAQYPNDPTILSMLSEAEFDAGNSAESIAAADKGLAIDPKRSNALVQKIYAQYRIALDADKDEVENAAWKDLRSTIVKLNSLENDHPIPLIYNYLSLQGRGKAISTNAAHGIERALQLAPYDRNVRYMVIKQLVDEKKYRLAKNALQPLVNDPHRQTDDSAAQRLLDIIELGIKAEASDVISES